MPKQATRKDSKKLLMRIPYLVMSPKKLSMTLHKLGQQRRAANSQAKTSNPKISKVTLEIRRSITTMIQKPDKPIPTLTEKMSHSNVPTVKESLSKSSDDASKKKRSTIASITRTGGMEGIERSQGRIGELMPMTTSLQRPIMC
jgi:hypothetical protein